MLQDEMSLKDRMPSERKVITKGYMLSDSTHGRTVRSREAESRRGMIRLWETGRLGS